VYFNIFILIPAGSSSPVSLDGTVVLTGTPASRRRRDTASLLTAFNAIKFASAIVTTLNSPYVSASDIVVSKVDPSPSTDQLTVSFSIVVDSQSASQVSSMLTAACQPPWNLLRSIVFGMSQAFSNASFTPGVTVPISGGSSNPVTTAIYQQLGQLYSIQDSASAISFNVSSAEASLASTLAAVQARFKVGSPGDPGTWRFFFFLFKLFLHQVFRVTIRTLLDLLATKCCIIALASLIGCPRHTWILAATWPDGTPWPPWFCWSFGCPRALGASGPHWCRRICWAVCHLPRPSRPCWCVSIVFSYSQVPLVVWELLMLFLVPLEPRAPLELTDSQARLLGRFVVLFIGVY
jgi:hypothetical protein